jgi:hypothetical protein
MIQLRHVPQSVHRKLKARAAMSGMSLSAYLVREVTRVAEQPTMEEALAEIAKLAPVKLAEPSATTVRKMREGR